MRHTFKTLRTRLTKAGFKKNIINHLLLPDWWNDECENDPTVLPEIESRVARFLGVSISTVREQNQSLIVPSLANVKLRRVRHFESDQLAPAVHTAKRIAEAVVRNISDEVKNITKLPKDGLQWRNRMLSEDRPLTLDDILDNLWHSGIPVIPIEIIPSPSFQGAAFIINDRPVIVLAHRYDAPSHVSFIVAHEAGHIAAGDCQPDSPVVDEEDYMDDSDIEVKADKYAKNALLGDVTIPKIQTSDFKDLAEKASVLEEQFKSDASLIIFNWAKSNGDYPTAQKAVKALYKGHGARKCLGKHIRKHINSENASDTDLSLLNCIYYSG